METLSLSPDERSNSCPPVTSSRSQFPATSSAKSEPMIYETQREVVVGVCAMNRKTLAAPMQSILSRMRQHRNIRIVVFSDETILNLPADKWPVCDCLIAFFSKGFPLQKAIEYTNLHRPMLFNDLEMQYVLQDREKVYRLLTSNDIQVPCFAVLKRRDGDRLIEAGDTIDVNGQMFHKPFVEKPISAEDHNVHIYFCSDYGGGCQKLFRKIGNRSSSYASESAVRRGGSYIYEEFLATEGVDVKVYVVGPDYAHAEARKCPSLDGIVVRDSQGIEERYPVILTSEEKLIARKVCLAFKQTVCGFDLLRANGKSYVCDVNGFSFVKKSEKYYDDCAQILLEMIISRFAPEYFPNIPPSVEYLAEDVPVPIPKTSNNMHQLRCVIGIIRHGERTPKQKMKMIVTHKTFYDLFEESRRESRSGHVKIKEPKQLQKLLDITRSLLKTSEKLDEETHKLQQLKAVLEMYGHFSGINRKVQFKLVKCRPISDDATTSQGLLLILKWGGELTLGGKRQAEDLGRGFRCMYPGGEGEYASLPGSGFLRLHSTYRHDLKVYASDEGRVQMTAASFTRGLLDLEGNLASVRTHLVRSDQNATDLLDTSNGAEEPLMRVKHQLHKILRSSDDFTEESREELSPTESESVLLAMKFIKNPKRACEHLYQLIRALTDEIRSLVSSGVPISLYHNETPHVMLQRWAKLEKDFKSDGEFDISKIPDIYDCIKYDLLHNRKIGLQNSLDLFQSVMYFADIVIPQEYGITKEEKLYIGKTICNPLLGKIRSDLHHVVFDESSDINHRLDPRLSRDIFTPMRHVRTRLYFTSESHIHCIINILRYGGLFGENADKRCEGWKKLSETPELDFLSQIVFLLFEDQSKPIGSPERYYVNIHIGAGMKTRQGAYEMERNLMLMSQEKHSSSFVKRLPNPYASNFKRVSYSAPANLKHLETFQRGQLFGLSDQSLLTLGEPGFVLAAELSSMVEPLTEMGSLPVHQVVQFLTDMISRSPPHTDFPFPASTDTAASASCSS